MDTCIIVCSHLQQLAKQLDSWDDSVCVVQVIITEVDDSVSGFLPGRRYGKQTKEYLG